MKKTKIIATLLSFACTTASVFTLGACNKMQQTSSTEIELIYEQYTIHAQANGEQPLSYEEWLTTIKGEKGDKGDTGADGKSAYEIWLANGHTGSEADFLEWLKATNDLHYQKIADKDEYRVVGLGLMDELNIVIPKTHENLPVTTIGACAFQNAFYITSVTIPDSVTTIEYRAFYGCISLAEIKIPKSVTVMKGDIFTHCKALTNVRFNGTKEEWNTLTNNISLFSSQVTITCLDGTINIPNDTTTRPPEEDDDNWVSFY